jgi:hypothetical protein
MEDEGQLTPDDKAQLTAYRIIAWALLRLGEVVVIGLCFWIWTTAYPDAAVADSLFSSTGMLVFASIFFQIVSGYFVSSFLFCVGSRRLSFLKTVAMGVGIYAFHFGIFYLLMAREFVWEVTEFSFWSGLVASFISAMATYRMKVRSSPLPQAG